MMSYYSAQPTQQQQPAMIYQQAGMMQQPGYIQQQPGMIYQQQQPGMIYQQQQHPGMLQQQPRPISPVQQQQQPVMMQQQQPRPVSPVQHVEVAHASHQHEPGRTSPTHMMAAQQASSSSASSQMQINALATLRQRITADSALYPADVMSYCTDACLSRYLRARDWDIEAAYKMLRTSLDWRTSFKPHQITEAQIQGPLHIGTMFTSGFDKLNRPVIYVKPGAQSPNTIDERILYVVWLMEHVTSIMSDGVEQVQIIMDFSEFGKRAKSPDSRQTAQAIINILQNHYPERLGSAIVINSPWYFNLLFKMMSPFINANTKKKMAWITGDHQQIYQQLCQAVDPDQLLTIYGGRNGNFPAGDAQH